MRDGRHGRTVRFNNRIRYGFASGGIPVNKSHKAPALNDVRFKNKHLCQITVIIEIDQVIAVSGGDVKRHGRSLNVLRTV